jgi:hypothetical protein
MHLLIDGYNLLHIIGSLISPNSVQLQWERDRLINQLSAYQKVKPCKITVVFDGWQAGWSTEKKESRKGIELIFSKLGEKADEVIKRLVKEKGSGAIVVTSDRDIARYAERMAVSVISSEQFRKKLEGPTNQFEEVFEEEEEEGGIKKKGLARRLSKKEKRARAALRKL